MRGLLEVGFQDVIPDCAECLARALLKAWAQGAMDFEVSHVRHGDLARPTEGNYGVKATSPGIWFRVVRRSATLARRTSAIESAEKRETEEGLVV